ncbi:MAG: hypothetical protein ACYTF6_02755 [Planctomycetota bacterium]|jgi:hypothetical protein
MADDVILIAGLIAIWGTLIGLGISARRSWVGLLAIALAALLVSVFLGMFLNDVLPYLGCGIVLGAHAVWLAFAIGRALKE